MDAIKFAKWYILRALTIQYNPYADINCVPFNKASPSLKDSFKGIWWCLALKDVEINISATLANGARSPEAPKDPCSLIIGSAFLL